ncbi:hypothetical protein B0H65DRAFT_420947 [Neurospora tetraspora]|uniref:Uncharacterized protein n=1 Tax=Neurospora tetraspora TaxID=94610 RepID=A0AAE0JLS1_9PEZI|nr:hypothetical protein B0H65DRAFT_420947 [Neurospora tetraspora]
MSETTMEASWPIGQSYLERLPTEIVEKICKALEPQPTEKYLQRTHTEIPFDRSQPVEVFYPSDPIDSQSYLESRQALYNLSLVSKARISPVARKQLLRKILINDPECLLDLAKCLALYPETRPHVKWLGIDSQFVSRCQFLAEGEGLNACMCDGESCGERELYHRIWDTERLGLEEPFMWTFEEVLKVPDMKCFPDMGQLLHLVRLMQYSEGNLWYFMDDRVFEQICNIALKIAIFFSPNLQTLRLTARGTESPSFLFRYAMGLIPVASENLGTYTVEYKQDVAKFLTTLDMDVSSMRHFSTNRTASNIPPCPATLEELTLVDDGPTYLPDDNLPDDVRCRGIEPHQLYTWLKPTKRLRKLRLYSGLDVDGLTMTLRMGPGISPYSLNHNINTILLTHRETLQHFEWYQMMVPLKTDEAAWIKMFGQGQKLSCLPHLKELRYLKLSDMFVYTRQQYRDRYPRARAAVYPAVRDLRNYRAVLAHNLSELGAPPKARSVYVGGHLPTDRYMRIDL